MKTTVAALISTFGLFATSAQAAHTIDGAAHALQQQAAAITQELRHHFRDVPEYRHLYQDAYEVYTLAAHIHEIAHDRASLHHIESDLQELDVLFHHLEDTVADAQRRTRYVPDHGSSRRGHGHGRGSHWSDRGRSTLHPYYWQRLSRLIHEMGDTLHELQEVVAESRSPRRPVGGRVVVPPPTVFVPVPVPAPTRIPLYEDKKGRFSFSLVLP